MSDLISRKEVIDDILKLAKEPSVQRNPDSVNGLLGAYNIVYEKPSVDIMECARAIKEYCNQFSKCEDCGCLNKNYCAFYTCPDEWNLPGERERR